MAETEQPQTNGLENGLDDADERGKMRPADIDADVREMERRKRVESMMNSRLFREELERIIDLQMKDGSGPAGLLQQISDMMGIQPGRLQMRGSSCLNPINDIRGVESMGYAKGEKNLRCKAACVFRLMDLYGWSQGIHNMITVRLSQDQDHFLVNPHGMLSSEVTASSLAKVEMAGTLIESGTTNYKINVNNYLLHSAIHGHRPDLKCLVHVHTPAVLAISALKCGLLPLCEEAIVIGEVSQHPFNNPVFEPEEREKIIRNLGPTNKVLLLTNHGAVCGGATVEEAFYNVYNTVLACETQLKLLPAGIDNLVLIEDEARKLIYDAAHKAPPAAADAPEKRAKVPRIGELEFEALVRMLDNAGFRTGYIYRHPFVKGEVPRPKNDVEVPPAVSSLGYLIEEEEMYRSGNWKKYVDGRNRFDRSKWLNSPNVYQKVEILETGTPDPKKITKWVDQNSEEWVADSSPQHSSTPVKIDAALQFVPQGTNPKEFKKLQQQMKENRRADKITSGPQSHILEGVSWEEAKKLQENAMNQSSDQVILVGAASKGIIQRNFQHNAMVYKTPYAKNPFDSISDKEIEDYKKLIERKQRGDTDYEESQSESEAVSSSRQDALRHIKSPIMSPQSATSETEEESRDEPRVLRIETKTAPRAIQAEVVLSDAESDATDARVERSQSARYPQPEKPENVTIMRSFRKSWSLKRDKDKSKDESGGAPINPCSYRVVAAPPQRIVAKLHYIPVDDQSQSSIKSDTRKMLLARKNKLLRAKLQFFGIVVSERPSESSAKRVILQEAGDDEPICLEDKNEKSVSVKRSRFATYQNDFDSGALDMESMEATGSGEPNSYLEDLTINIPTSESDSSPRSDEVTVLQVPVAETRIECLSKCSPLSPAQLMVTEMKKIVEELVSPQGTPKSKENSSGDVMRRKLAHGVRNGSPVSVVLNAVRSIVSQISQSGINEADEVIDEPPEMPDERNTSLLISASSASWFEKMQNCENSLLESGIIQLKPNSPGIFGRAARYCADEALAVPPLVLPDSSTSESVACSSRTSDDEDYMPSLYDEFASLESSPRRHNSPVNMPSTSASSKVSVASSARRHSSPVDMSSTLIAAHEIARPTPRKDSFKVIVVTPKKKEIYTHEDSDSFYFALENDKPAYEEGSSDDNLNLLSSIMEESEEI